MSNARAFNGILLDMDGLLLDTERLAVGCWHEAETRTGFRMPDGFYFTLIGQSMPMIERRLVEVMHPDCDIAEFLRVANGEYKRVIKNEAIPVKKGVREFLAFLREREIPTCVATSTFRRLADHKLEATGLAEFLLERVCGDEVAQSKPAPDIYLAAAERLSAAPSALVAVEDSENGILSAHAAGCHVLHVPDIAPVSLETQALAGCVYRDMLEVMEAMLRGELLIQGRA